MLCSSCRRSLLARLPHTFHPSPSSRLVSTIPTTSSAPPSQPPPATIDRTSKPPALSSSVPGISQPFSTPMLPSTSSAKPSSNGKELPKPTKLSGSIPGGAPLLGLGYLKAKPSVLAMEDDAYPEWLWGLVNERKKTALTGETAADLSGLIPPPHL